MRHFLHSSKAGPGTAGQHDSPGTTGARRRLRVLLLQLSILLVATPLVAQDDPGWVVVPNTHILDDYHVAPDSPALAKSIHDAAEYVGRFQLPADAEGWWRRRPEVERALRRAIGLEHLPERSALNPRIVATHDMGGYILQNLIFESRPGFPVTANLYTLQGAHGKRPAVVCPIWHYLSGGKANPDIQARCIKLAEMGYVALVYDAIGQGERLIAGNIHHEAGYALLPLGETIAGWMVWDSMRALDYLLSRDDVDPERTGITGNSGGGLNTLFTAALDDRFRAAAVAGYVFTFNNWMKYGGPHCTCTQLPGLFRGMEWFEVAGLIAPRAVLMLQGEMDGTFPVQGVRPAGHATEALFALLGYPQRARLDIIANRPHEYSRPFRERMYGWMEQHLMGHGNGEPLPEGEVQPLAEDDPRLLCDRDGSIMPRSPSVVELARKRAEQVVSKLPEPRIDASRRPAERWARALTAPPTGEFEPLEPDTIAKTESEPGVLEKVLFLSEIGQYVPGLLWLPSNRPSRPEVVIIVHDRGKQAVATSGLVDPLRKAGLAVLSVDLRGRGETLGTMGPGKDLNFRFAGHSVLWGEPLAGRRAFDLKRAVDYVALRKDLTLDNLTVVGLGDDALPAMLAAATDMRIRRLAVAGYFRSFASQMIAADLPNREERVRQWNGNAMRTGRIQGAGYEVDLGDVIPAALESADIPDVLALVAPRKVLYCQVRDQQAAGFFRSRFERVADSVAGGWIQYDPSRPLDSAWLLEWLGEGKK